MDDPEYAIDRNAVFHRSLKVKNADPASFHQIDRFYWRDAKRVFFVDAEIRGADPETFRPFPKYPWARDRTDVYTGTIALNVQDIATFTLLEGVWAKDSKAYYADSGLLAHKTVPCDYASFVVLNGHYAKDMNRGYWCGTPIDGSDGASFVAVTEWVAKDKHREYSGLRKR